MRGEVHEAEEGDGNGKGEEGGEVGRHVIWISRLFMFQDYGPRICPQPKSIKG
jgi:hypothetical protein